MKKYFVGEIFWESVPFLLWQHISLNAYQEANESASSHVKGGCQQECFIFTVRVDVDICIWVSLLGLTGFHWFYFHRNVFIKVPFFETVPSTKYIDFFFPWEYNGALYFCLGWKWKGMLPNVSNPQMSLVWMEYERWRLAEVWLKSTQSWRVWEGWIQAWSPNLWRLYSHGQCLKV